MMKALVLLAASTLAHGGAAPTLELSGSGTATFGYLFAPGDIPKGKSPAAQSASGKPVFLQVDVKATHPDGSLRHAVLTMASEDNLKRTVTLVPADPPPAATPVGSADLLASAFEAEVSLVIAGKTWRASAKPALKAGLAAGKAKTWLSGPMVSEWLVSTPFHAGQEAHPHLSARFAIRAYRGLQSVRVDITVENTWAYEPGPRGYAYDAAIKVGGKDVYAKAGLQHTHHSRWRRVFWWGTPPGLEARLDRDYLLETGAVPRYDRGVRVSHEALAKLAQSHEPMSNGDMESYMASPGAHSDIGPMPRFAAIYLLTTDKRAKANLEANGACGGSYSSHYRDKKKDLPVSIDDYPYAGLHGTQSDMKNPATRKIEAFPEVTEGMGKHIPDDAHQPSIAYLPYLVTGDFFFLEELQFWTHFNFLYANPHYRELSKGLAKWAQVRGQAWILRTLAHAAYITPDAHPLKRHYAEKLGNNLDWYLARMSRPEANKLGWNDAGHALAYEPNGIAPWQDDFFTWAIGHIVDLGYAEALPLLRKKATFVTGRMSDIGYCWLKAGTYSLQVGPADKSRYYDSFAELYAANFPKAPPCQGKVMDGHPQEPNGWPSHLQPALAAAVDAGAPGAAEAWARYQSRHPKQDFSMYPQFAVVPKASKVAKGP